MTTIFIKHTVEDYDSWKPVFDDWANTREEYGSHEDYRLFHEAGNPNEVVMIAEWESAEAFQRFMEESGIKEVFGEGDVVISEPEVYLLEETEAKTAEQPSGATST